MTPLALIERRWRMLSRVIYVGGALFIGAIVADKLLGMPQWIWVPGFTGFAVAWLTMAGTYVIGFRCPYCRGKLTTLVMQRARIDFHFCPYCGKDLDAEFQAAAQPAPDS